MQCCPPTDQLRRLLTEEVSGPEYAALEAHIEGCAACQAALERLDAAGAADGTAPGRLREAEPDLDAGFLGRLKQLPRLANVPVRLFRLPPGSQHAGDLSPGRAGGRSSPRPGTGRG